jgi:1-phosphofructokinase family hexose kinase
VILAAGLTPAWQHILVIKGLRIGEVNRAVEAHWCASGKVINAGMALHQLGGTNCTLALLGGATGQNIDREFEERGIAHRWLWGSCATRVCTTVLDPVSGTATELVENAPPITDSEIREFKLGYQELVPKARVVILIGSLPAGVPRTLYRDLVEQTSCRVVLDIRGPELIETLPLNPFLVKPNREELGKTVGRDLSTDEELRAAIMELHHRGAEWVVVSQGKNALWLGGADGIHVFRPPTISVVNPIASGDCLAAGIAWAIERGLSMSDAIKTGMGAAAQNASALLPARIDPDTSMRLAAEVAELS